MTVFEHVLISLCCWGFVSALSSQDGGLDILDVVSCLNIITANTSGSLDECTMLTIDMNSDALMNVLDAVHMITLIVN